MPFGSRFFKEKKTRFIVMVKFQTTESVGTHQYLIIDPFPIDLLLNQYNDIGTYTRKYPPGNQW